MTASFIPGRFDSAALHHDGQGNWSLVILIQVELERGYTLNTRVTLPVDVVRRELLSKVMSLCEGL